MCCESNTLPIEMWRKIFHEAVYIPGVLDTQWNSSHIDSDLWTGWSSLKDLVSRSPGAMKIRKAIVLVSRLWMQIGMDFLYEFVQIRKQEDLATLLSVFKVQIGEQPHHQRGWWIKRIEVTTELRTSLELFKLSRFLMCCYNVQILSAPWRPTQGNPFYPLIPTIVHRFRRSLRRMPLTIDYTSVLDTHTDWLQEVPFQSLEIDITQPVSPVRTFRVHTNPTSAFDNVTTLTLSLNAFDGEKIHWYFPQLRHLSLTTIGFNIYSFLHAFLSTHADTLISLHVISIDVIGDLSEALASCRKLRNLALDHIDLDRLNPIITLPTIERLSVYALPSQDSIRVVSEALEGIVSEGDFPMLKHVQVTGTYDQDNTAHIELLQSTCIRHGLALKLGQSQHHI